MGRKSRGRAERASVQATLPSTERTPAEHRHEPTQTDSLASIDAVLDELRSIIADPKHATAIAQHYRADAGSIRASAFHVERTLLAARAVVLELRALRASLTGAAVRGTQAMAQSAPRQGDGGSAR